MRASEYIRRGGTFPVQVKNEATGLVVVLEASSIGKVIVKGSSGGDINKDVGYRSTAWSMDILEVLE